MITITAYPRLHITLIGMNSSEYRINGGIGFAIDSPKIVISARGASNFSLIDYRIGTLDDAQLEKLRGVVNKIKTDLNFKKNISVKMRGEMPTHSGFGSGTIIRLACIEALFLINEAEYTEDILVNLSGRGKTSGIGIRTYFHGGFVFEIGHPKSNEIYPSNTVEGLVRNSLLIENGKLPDWNIGILIPKNIKTLNQEEEVQFFERTVPISSIEVYETLYHVVFGLYASIKEKDFDTFLNSILKIQNCKWKSSEWGIYGNKLREYEDLLYKNGARAVGMSSLGPSLFFISDNIEHIIESMDSKYINEFTLLKSKTVNFGRTLS